MSDFLLRLKERPVIAAVRDMDGARFAAKTQSAAAFLLGGSILTLPDLAKCLRDAGKAVFVHIDLIEGLGKDAAGVEWCERRICPNGVISTKPALLKKAREAHLLTIQRLFAMDSASLSSGIRLLSANPPDMVEVLPGLLPRVIADLSAQLSRPIIAGGLITAREDVAQALAAGALAVSTGERNLW